VTVSPPASLALPDLVASIAGESRARHLAWEPFARGPREQWLECRGSWAQKLVSWVHFHWPSARGQWRLTRALASRERLRAKLSGVPFASRSGVEVTLDIPGDRFLFLSGRLAPEPVEVDLVTRLVGPGDVFVDVGAHWGLYLLHVLGRLRPGGTYVAAEPSGESFRFLSTAYRASPAELRLEESAVSDYDGEGRLIGDGSVHDRLVAAARGMPGVKVVTLDTLLAPVPLAGRRVFVKVDTEGHEAAVVRGCKGLAAAGVRPVFLLEFLKEMHGQTRDDVLGAFAATYGPVYDFWAVDASSGRLTRFESAAEVRGEVRNMLAVPRP
jgi:FkbM family methyltransferase